MMCFCGILYPQSLLDSQVFVQNIEQNVYENYNLTVLDNFYFNKHLIDKISTKDTAYNMGIFGGNNLEFIKKYANAAIQFTLDEDNVYCYNEMIKKYTYAVACLCEQYYLNICSKKWNTPITCLLNKTDEKKLEEEANQIGYTHINYGKDEPKIKENLYLRLKELGIN